MPCPTAFVWSGDYELYNFGPWHPYKPYLWRLAMEELERLGVFDHEGVDKVLAEAAGMEELTLVHTRHYIMFVKRKCEDGYGFLDYGDTPAAPGVYEGAVSRVGGTLTAARLVMEGRYIHAFNLGGGLHHARPSSASGFCVFNDIAVAVRYLQRWHGVKRVAVIDVDGHHADGTQDIFYSEREVLTISFHRYGIYPGTGWHDEVGVGDGEGYSVNVPLTPPLTEASYLYAFREIVPPLIRSYKPEIVFLQYGADSHRDDPLVGLPLSTHGYQEIASIVHGLAHEASGGKLVVTGGGGYNPDNVRRIWAIGFITVSGVAVSEEELRSLHDEAHDPGKVDKPVVELVEKIKRLVFPYHGIDV